MPGIQLASRPKKVNQQKTVGEVDHDRRLLVSYRKMEVIKSSQYWVRQDHIQDLERFKSHYTYKPKFDNLSPICTATYKKVNRLTDNERDTAILSDFHDLVSDLERIRPQEEIPIILVKANICRLLEERLTSIGFNVINNGVVIPFPSHGHQKRFHSEMNKILTLVGD